MAASVVGICNLSLSLIGAENVSSLSEASTQARACNQFYETARDGLLSAYPWGFATKGQTLAEIINDKAGEWAHAYTLPADALKVLAVRPLYEEGVAIPSRGAALRQMEHAYEGAKVYSNIEKAVLLYTARVEDPALYPPLFVNALAYHLAGWLAMPLNRSGEIQGRMMQLAQSAILSAQAHDAAQEGHEVEELGSFARARL